MSGNLNRMIWTVLLGIAGIIAIFIWLPLSQAIFWAVGVVVLLGYSVAKMIRSKPKVY